MVYTQADYQKILKLLQSEDKSNIELGLALLQDNKISETMQVALLWQAQHYSYLEDFKDRIFALLRKKRIYPPKIDRIFQTLKLFYIPYDTYRWYSQHTYNAEPEDIREILALYPKIQAQVEGLLDWDAKFREDYATVSKVLWTYYAMPEARSFLQKTLEYQSDTFDLYFYIAQTYQKEQNFDKAIEFFQRYIELAPRYLPDNEYRLDEWYMDLRMYLPSTLWAWRELGEISEIQKNDLAHAEYCYQQAIDLAPTNHQAPLDKLADLWLKMGKSTLDQILDLRLQALRVAQTTKAYPPDAPKIAQAYTQIGDTYYLELNDHDKALACYKRSLYLQPRQTAVILRQAELVLRYYRDYWQARALYEKILQYDHQNLEAKQSLSKVKKQLKC
ncbi:MAG: tetratricopeptide repeat protein [Microscillaceae bacterium]|jgi:tetratricopeptide (TPR) repeat protein|nr:tetratricopeptide repeat protein [Microscillaceae bacterium]